MRDVTTMRLSFSTLRNLLKSQKYFLWALEQPKLESKSLTIGTVVDIMLTSPGKFEEEYIILEHAKPTGQLGIFIDKLLEFDATMSESGQNREIWAYEQVDFKRATFSAIMARFDAEGVDYYNEQKSVLNGLKKPIPKDVYERAVKVYESLLNNQFTWHYFKEQEGIELINQLEIVWSYSDIDFKSILDIIRINHNTKTIDVCDVKTTGKPLYQFKNSVIEYDYWLQLTMYALAIYQWIEKTRPELYGWDVNLKWIVEYTEYPGNPEVFVFSEYETGFNGGTINNRKIKGFKQLIDDFKWYNKNGWEHERNKIENNGEIPLTIFD